MCVCGGGGDVLTTNGHAFRINTIFPAMLQHVFRGRDALVETLGKGMFRGQTISETYLHFYIKRERNVLFNDALNTFIYGYMASDIWLRTILIVRKETRCYCYRLIARVLLYAPSHRQDSTYHGLCYTSRDQRFL